MMRQITLGQYYKANSLIHGLDPRVKLAGTLLFVLTLFFPRTVWAVGIATLFLAAVISLSKVPLRLLIKGVRPLLIVIAFSAVVHIFFTEGTVLVTWGVLQITKEGLATAAYLVIRLVYLIIGSAIMTFTTTPKELTDGIEKALSFLNVLRIPVHEFAMMMSIALRFIPILTEELDKIKKAQMSRGVDFESGNLMERAGKFIPILIPLFVSAIRRASELALAMDARCYNGGQGRTKLHPLHYNKKDYIAYGILFLYVLAMTGVSFL